MSGYKRPHFFAEDQTYADWAEDGSKNGTKVLLILIGTIKVSLYLECTYVRLYMQYRRCTNDIIYEYPVIEYHVRTWYYIIIWIVHCQIIFGVCDETRAGIGDGSHLVHLTLSTQPPTAVLLVYSS